MYKFLRDSIFVDDQNLVYFQGSFAINHCATYMHFKVFKDFIFAADKLPTKTVKIKALENLCTYSKFGSL